VETINFQGIMSKRLIFTVILLTVSNLINYVDRLLVGVLGPDIKRDLALSDTQFGLLTGPAFALSYSAASILCGFLADSASRRAFMSVGFALWSAMTLASGYTSNFLQLSLARAGYGLGASAFGPAAFSYWSDSNIPANRRSLVFGIFHAGSMTGILTGFVVGGAVAAHYGWRAAFIASGAIGLVLAIALPALIPEPPRGSAGTVPVKPRFSETFALLLNNRPYLYIMMGIGIANFAGVGIVSWLPLFFARSHGMSHETLAFLFGPALALGMTFGMLSGGWVGDRLTRYGKAAPLFLCAGACLAVTLLYWIILTVPYLSVALVLIVIAAALSVIFIPAYSVVMQSILQSHVRATALSVIVFVANVFALGILPVVVGALSDGFTPRFGADALRYALIIVLTGNLAAAWAFERARRAIGDNATT
jgi:MFS family permease